MRPVLTGLAAASALVLCLPVTSANASTTHPVTLRVHTQTARADRYTVRPGDTLTRIAARLCGQAARWASLYHANRAVTGPDPDLILPGQHLTVACSGPPAITTAARWHQAARTAPARHGSYYSPAALASLWESAGGPAWAAARAARIAMCESGGNIYAHNSSGATGLFQILGLPFPGNPYDPFTNARMAVTKFRAAGNTFSPWVCRG